MSYRTQLSDETTGESLRWNGSAWVTETGGGTVDDTPADGHTTDSISSNWAYDHVAAADPHTGYALESDALTVNEGEIVGRLSGGSLDGLTAAQVTTLILGTPLAENTAIQLDAALSADEKYSGIVEAGVAGCTTNFGDLLYLAVADLRWELTDADAEATTKCKLGINVTTAQKVDGEAFTVLLWGKVRSDADYAFTIGAPVFVSLTAGDVTSTIPPDAGDFVRIVGYGNTADELFFCPENSWIERV